MLDRFYDRCACIKFWKTKWCGLVLATEIWIVAYNVFLCVAEGVQLDGWSLVRNMFFLEAVPMGHMWYMPMIIGLYLFLPFIANGLKMLNDGRLLAFPLGIMIVLCFVAPVAGVFVMAHDGVVYSFIVAPGFSGGVYGCYMLLGYCVRKNVFSRVPTAFFAGILVIAFFFVVAVQLYGYAHEVRAAVWYDNGLLLLAGLGLFLWLSRALSLRKVKIISILSYYSFALYLVHYPIKILLAPLMCSLGIPSSALQVIVLSVLVLVISLVVCAVIARIPKVGGKILYMR